MIYGNSVGGIGLERTYILVDDDGNEYPATLVDTETVFDATENDIRLGKVAATQAGVTVGEKDIPAYHTSEGTELIRPGKTLRIYMFSDNCQYTKLQALVCEYGETSASSVSTIMVVINNTVYGVNSIDPLSAVTVDVENQTIELGITNTSENSYIIRYMTYREEE